MAEPLSMFVDSPDPVHVFVGERLIGAAWLEKTVEVHLEEGQTLALVCGQTRLEPRPYTGGPMEVVVRKTDGPCRIGKSDAPKLLAIIGTHPDGDGTITDLWSDPNGLGNIDEALAGIPSPAPAPTAERIRVKATGLDCTRGCDHPGATRLRDALRRTGGQLMYCAERHQPESMQIELVIERDGTSVGKGEAKGVSEATASCIEDKMTRWRLPEGTPVSSEWRFTLEKLE